MLTTVKKHLFCLEVKTGCWMKFVFVCFFNVGCDVSGRGHRYAGLQIQTRLRRRRLFSS